MWSVTIDCNTQSNQGMPITANRRLRGDFAGKTGFKTNTLSY